MRDYFRLSLSHGTSMRLVLEREHPAAGYTAPNDYIVCLPDNRSIRVENVIQDLNNGKTYAVCNGILYDDAEQYVEDLKWLRDHDWYEVTNDYA